MDRVALRRVSAAGVPGGAQRFRDREAEEAAARIVSDVESRGEAAVREWASRLGELSEGEELVLGRGRLEAALASLGREERGLLERARGRIAAFAEAQRAALRDTEIAVPGGRAGHRFIPVSRAGCYVPGGRFPLPSSALMTACAAKAAGVASVWCAGPRPAPITLAAAALAGAEGFVAAGGAQGIAALAFGAGCPPCEVVVGPGGRHAAAAKRLLFGLVGTEAPAGPSELLVVADEGADPALAAADLLAQAEHDPSALPALAAPSEAFAAAVEEALARGLERLPPRNAEAARAALAGGWILVYASLEEAAAAADRFAPEHLELLLAEPESFAARARNAGAVFLGAGAAEVMGDYGAGPNHCLPTGGAARFAAGLSVLSFLRARTWLELEEPAQLAREAEALARLEGLEAHALAAAARLG
ncbi:MAG TPA: histidinol dehydrogenase [Spirochaetales bacterium]|nr:histidinol dehydrogenase [Spirochaetales bacterium]HRY53954.1 histidinol dehydrogenase [Spirochaetia bacterium]HRZ64128.1 histidinol dehydrogenase [Spirochaetia bacterium]